MTGMTAHRNGLMGLVNFGWSMPRSTRTIVDHLNDAGYMTVHCGMQHERQDDKANRYRLEMKDFVDDPYKEHAESALKQAVLFLETRQKEVPFYLNIGIHEVHCTNWMEQVSYNEERKGWYGKEDPDNIVLPDWMPDFMPFRHEFARFYAAITYTDRKIGGFLRELDRFGLWDDTMVIFTTDHGIAANRAKTTLYDRGVETALLVKAPGCPPGRTSDCLIRNTDVAPTILEACGLPIPDTMDGSSFYPLLAGRDYVPHPYIVTERNYHGGVPAYLPLPEGSRIGYDPTRAVRSTDFHYIRYFDTDATRPWYKDEIKEIAETYTDWYDFMLPPCPIPRDSEELFDIRSGPGEYRNRAGDPAYADVLEEMRGILDAWMIQTCDPLLDGPIPDRMNGWDA